MIIPISKKYDTEFDLYYSLISLYNTVEQWGLTQTQIKILIYLIAILGVAYSVVVTFFTYSAYKELNKAQQKTTTMNLLTEFIIAIVSICYIINYHIVY